MASPTDRAIAMSAITDELVEAFCVASEEAEGADIGTITRLGAREGLEAIALRVAASVNRERRARKNRHE